MTNDLLSLAKDAIQRGDKAAARTYLRGLIRQSPENAQAWFMLATVVKERQHVIDCLERGLRYDPDNQAAQRALATLTQVTAKPLPVPEDALKPLAPSTEVKASEWEELSLQADVAEPIKPRHLKINWSLIIGALIVFLVSLCALIGPEIAPRDPLEENVIIKIGDSWETPPLAPFQFKAYPLGTDQFGRDMLSRVLWALQPTLVMVVTVALVRLFLGTLIGLSAGWATGSIGHWLDILITGALAVPVFIITLGAIAMLGAEMGLMAFVIGFSINGWGETARIVREQTQTVKKNLYIEAAQALGAPRRHVIFSHILRQIMPMIWMLLAFEISNTLMVTAGLGFLGYYIGGDVWIEVGDFVSRRVSGMPELGQMLATSWALLTKPWPMVITGTIIFITILGFNLLGEGLRASLNPEIVKMKNPFRDKTQRLSWWWEEQVAMPTSQWMREHPLVLVVVGVLLAVFIGGFYWWRTQIYPQTVVLDKALPIPGDHLWGVERGDPYGTLWSDSRGPDQPNIEWQFESEVGFSGGPVIASDQSIYIGANDGHLLVLQTDGQTILEFALPETPVGSPALSAEGLIYISDQAGGLSAIDPTGELLWHFQPDEDGEPVHSPIVDLDGNIYYLLSNYLISLTQTGELRWSVRTSSRPLEVGPRLNPDGDLIYLQNMVINSQDGSQVEIETPADQDPVLANRVQFLTGADGERYLHVGHNVIQWQQGRDGFEVIQSAEWDYTSAGFNQSANFPQDAGVTPDHVAWLFYSWRYGGTKLVWVDVSGKLLGISWTNLRQRSKLIAIDSANTAVICGVEDALEEVSSFYTKCLAFAEGSEEPKWELTLSDQGNEVIGTAMASGRLYVVTDAGILYALDQTE